MTRRTTKEILFEVRAGRERQNQSHGDPATHCDAPHRFHSLQHQLTPPRASIKTRGTIGKFGSAMIKYVIRLGLPVLSRVIRMCPERGCQWASGSAQGRSPDTIAVTCAARQSNRNV